MEQTDIHNTVSLLADEYYMQIILDEVGRKGNNATGIECAYNIVTRNKQLNMLALVCKGWHCALAPESGRCIRSLTRWMFFSEKTLNETTVAFPSWWQKVKAIGLSDEGLILLSIRCPTLSCLILEDCDRTSTEGLLLIPCAYKCLTSLKISLPFIKGENIADFRVRKTQHVEKLKLNEKLFVEIVQGVCPDCSDYGPCSSLCDPYGQY